ncbi:tetratricopeptide repeat protein [Flavobacterium sp. 3-210]
MEKPIVQNYHDNNWEFINPKSIDNEEVSTLFWNAVDYIDNNSLLAEKILKKLIAEHPYYIDAYIHLSIAFRTQGKDFESLLAAEKAFKLGIGCLPETFDLKKDKIAWFNINNRPFLRACQNFGLECHYHKKFSEAAEIYKLNLDLNEEDHQGIRYLLLETLFAAEEYKKAEDLLHQHADDFSIEFKFGTVAIHILNGNFEQADKHLKEAIKTNLFFINEVLKSKHLKPLPYRIPGEPNFDAGIPTRSVQEAYDYWKRNEALYKNKKIISYFKTAQKKAAKQ